VKTLKEKQERLALLMSLRNKGRPLVKPDNNNDDDDDNQNEDDDDEAREQQQTRFIIQVQAANVATSCLGHSAGSYFTCKTIDKQKINPNFHTTKKKIQVAMVH
jgi:hypothetical protein